MSSPLTPEQAAAIAEQLAEALGPRPLLDAAAAARLLNVPASWLLAAAREDKCPHRRFGKYVRFDSEELLAWSESHARGPKRAGRGAAA